MTQWHAWHARRTAVREWCLAVLVTCAICAAIVAIASAKTTYSADPPAWVRSATPVCSPIDLRTGDNYSGQSGPLAGGYNVYLLQVVDKRGMTCSRARQLARRDWLEGHRGILSWRQRRAWRSTAGSAYVGDFRGTGKGLVVEYHAVH